MLSSTSVKGGFDAGTSPLCTAHGAGSALIAPFVVMVSFKSGFGGVPLARPMAFQGFGALVGPGEAVAKENGALQHGATRVIATVAAPGLGAATVMVPSPQQTPPPQSLLSNE
jgi:hypothetical protein